MRMRMFARFFAGPVMFVAGLNHFLNPAFYERTIPPALPEPTTLVYASGIAEMAGALAAMHPRTRRAGGWLLLATLIAVFPANIFMVLDPDRFPSIPRWALLARLPLQLLFLYLVWLATLAPDARDQPAPRAGTPA